MDARACFHCGLEYAAQDEIRFDHRSFCCAGCRTVYELFSANGLTKYYDLERNPGATPNADGNRYGFLNNPEIAQKLLDFEQGDTCIATLNIPHIHCSSCIWILENLTRLQPGIVASQVNFPAKRVRIDFDKSRVSLQEIVALLASIGYEPYISLEDYGATKVKSDNSLTFRLAVAFFSFGNIMLLSFPEYFEVGEFWLEQYKGFFRWLTFALALPSFLYSANIYYVAAWRSIRARMLNIEIPIALGIVVMFIRSTADIVMGFGQGFFDSLTGLVFFMLLGKMFQMKTYGFLSFERDYKSYFPVAVTRIDANRMEESVPVHEIAKGDRLLVRNRELIPADGILISATASIDYSFVTGESIPVEKVSGDKLFAGGRHVGAPMEMQVLKPVSQSYLTQLWGNDVFNKQSESFETITNRISHYFTPVLLLIAFAGFGYWMFYDIDTAFNVFTAVLIVACPCALALTAPFTLGNVLRIFGREKFYLKNAQVIEQMAKIDTIVFDKTGTITSAKKSEISWQGRVAETDEISMIKSLLRVSNHPLSRMAYDYLEASTVMPVPEFEEVTGRGIRGVVGGHEVAIGSASFAGTIGAGDHLQTCVHVSIDGKYYGKFVFRNSYRSGLKRLFLKLGRKFRLMILSGDNEGERATLAKFLPPNAQMLFDRTPDEKLRCIAQLRDSGHNVMMVGDGLNDAGALAKSNVGVAVSENVNVFSPACDAILDASRLEKLDTFLALSKKAMLTIRLSFGLSLLYNVVGLSFAVTGNLLPLVAAIIMPLSTVTVISFVTLMSNWQARALRHRKTPAESTKRASHSTNITNPAAA